MKAMLPLIFLCLLLCGCTQMPSPEETTPPAESVVAETSRPEEYGGALQKIPLNLRKVHGLRGWNGNLLLFSGYGSTTLTVLQGETLEETASVTLDFDLDARAVRLHPDGTLSFFQPDTEKTVVLSPELVPLRQIPEPGGTTGTPVLSGDSLCYCTATHVRTWDLETDLRRILKEMSFDSQILADVLLDGAVLQCSVIEEGRESTLFLSSETGQQLYSIDGSCEVFLQDGRYYADLSAGYNRLSVYGSIGSDPMLLTPANPDAERFFLPELDVLLTAEYLEDNRVLLCRYDLTSGCLSGRLILESFLYPLGVGCTNSRLYLLTYDPAEERNLLLLWDDPQPEASPVSYAEPYWSRDLSGLRRDAAELGQRYGIEILIGPEAIEAEPWDYDLTEETLPSVLRQELSLLENRLSAYPETLLQQTVAHYSKLSLCLVRNIRGSAGPANATGVQFLDGTHAYIAIAAGKFSEQALYHELFHLMETHIYSHSKAFDRWNDLNPAGFEYDYDYEANAARDSGVYLYEDHQAFIDTYSMSYPKEDRARIMESAMLPGNDALFRRAILQAKLRVLCTGIRDAYGLEDWTEPLLWEQYLE